MKLDFISKGGKRFSILRKDIDEDKWKKYIVERTGRDRFARLPLSDPYEPKHSWDYPEDKQPAHKCNVFGCGRNISLQESLYGDYCLEHSGIGRNLVGKLLSAELL